ncbi:MAG: potassium-transporting ATPase subunit B, partial [Armatimonadetes bacterium]|nr:potassium-transporting ATPase subunit B [Armatimonadota bacterium]
MSGATRQPLALTRAMLVEALAASFGNGHPRTQVRNPVMFVVYVGAILTTAVAMQVTFSTRGAAQAFNWHIAAWLWFTVLFANFAEAVAEGRGKAQAETLRRTRQAIRATRLDEPRRVARMAC